MKEFAYRPEGFRVVRARQIRLVAGIFGFAFLLAGVVPVFLNPTRITALPYMFLIVVIAAAITIANSVAKQRTIYKTFKLSIDDTKLTVVRKGFPELTIFRNDLRSISKRSNGNLLIRGKNQYYTIYIFPFIDGQAELEEMLAQMKPIRVLKRSVSVFWFLPGVLIATAAIAGMAITSSDILKIISVGVLVFILAAGFFITQTNRKLDRTTQILSWGILVPLIVFVCYMLFR